jgi:hypothetical protein
MPSGFAIVFIGRHGQSDANKPATLPVGSAHQGGCFFEDHRGVGGKRLNKQSHDNQPVATSTCPGEGIGLNKNHAQKGRYRESFRDVPAFSSGLMTFAVMAALIIWETMTVLLSGNLNRSRRL